PFELTPDPGDVFVDLLARQQLPLLGLAARVADHSGAAPDDRDRRVAEPLHPREAHDGEQRSDVQARRRRIETDVAGDALLRERLRDAVRRLGDQPAPLQLVEKIRHEINGLLYQSMTALRRAQGRPEFRRGTVSRRAVLKTLTAAAGGAVAGTGAYGFLYGRHELSVTRAALSMPNLPHAFDGLRIGLITDVHRSRWVSHADISHA